MGYTRCPNCNHNPLGFSTSWMHIYKCPNCGKLFCHNCGSTTSRGVRCPTCKTESTDKVAKCHGT